MPKRFGLCCALLALSTSALAQSKGPAARLEFHSVGPRRVGGVPAGAGRGAGIPLQGTSGRDGGGGSAFRRFAVSRHTRERPVRRHGVHLRPPLRPASLCGQRTDPRSRRARGAYRGSAAGRSKVPRPGTLHRSPGIQTAERQQDGKSPSAGERALAAADRGARRAPGAGASGAIAGVAVSFANPVSGRCGRCPRAESGCGATAASVAGSTKCACGRCRRCPRAESGGGAASAATNTRAGPDGGNRADASRAPASGGGSGGRAGG